MQRLIPQHAQKFKFEIISPQDGHDCFEIESSANNLVYIRGNNGVSQASGLYWYLKEFCKVHFSWCGDQTKLPDIMPQIPTKITIINPHKFRVYMNYCTFNYSASWWDWDRWEREIDFMALNGINMPLSVVGIEAVWYETLLKMGLTDEETREFLCGPAFFAWQWMTNIQSHGGPLPKSWIETHILLGKKILQRQREYGMIPIQQGFTGFAPRCFKTKFPNAKIQQESKWCNFEGTMQLDPLDPLFKRVGSIFLEVQEELFGTSHHYAADPFHEGAPPKKGNKYLSQVGKAIYNLFLTHDPHAIWVMQAWSIRKYIAKAVPKDRLLILDLNGNTWKLKRKFWGYNFVAGRLHNFGGRINLHGDLQTLSENPFVKVKKHARNSVGMGLFMEGIMQNPIYYDLAFDLIWRDEALPLIDWIPKYITRRYGAFHEEISSAWSLLIAAVYRKGTDGVENSSMVCARPAVNVKKSGPNAGFEFPKNNHLLFEAWGLLLKYSPQLEQSSAYCFDIVDIGRQALSNLSQFIQKEIKKPFIQKDLTRFQSTYRQFLDLLEDIDKLVRFRDEYSFEKWVNDARKWSNTPDETTLYDFNATMLVTLWGPEKEPHIFDYAWREWSGLIRQYYIPRWKKFFSMLENCLDEHKDYKYSGLSKVHGRESFRANSFYSDLAEWETNWVKTPKKFLINPTEGLNLLEFANKLQIKYSQIAYNYIRVDQNTK